MKHKLTHKTKDGTLKEQLFDDFNEFADSVQDLALDYYAHGVNAPQYNVETIYNDQIIKQERVTNGRDITETEFLGE
tara:strand:+ start:1293 stop:1523 length:231 start_codon:yes stop_codon:yes gene_type:complete